MFVRVRSALCLDREQKAALVAGGVDRKRLSTRRSNGLISEVGAGRTELPPGVRRLPRA
ncbi:hypothetical protein ACQ4WX_22860 [Streptomyces lasalocidi]